jgi:hypothetical protein
MRRSGLRLDMEKRTLSNLGLLLVIVFPVWFFALGVSPYFTLGRWPRDWPGSWGGLLYIFLNMSLPLLAGGVVQQLLLLGIPQSWSAARRRTAAILSTVVILPASWIFGAAWALVPGLLVYTLVLRLPRKLEPAETSV